MFEAGRIGDHARAPRDAHDCPCCAHSPAGPALDGSPDVTVNGAGALRVGDCGVHSACCGGNRWTAVAGSASVFINGRPAVRSGDASEHCGGPGQLTAGSANVFVGNAETLGGIAGKQAYVGGPASFSLGFSDLELTAMLDGDIVLTAISDFQHGFKAGLASLAASVGEFFAIFGLGKLVGLCDLLVDGLGTGLKYVFLSVGRLLPGVDILLYSVRALLTQLMNVLLDAWLARPFNGACPIQAPAPMEKVTGVEKLAFIDGLEGEWKNILDHHDISENVGPLIHAYKPIFVQDPEDYPPISLELLLSHSKLRPAPLDPNPTAWIDYAEAIGPPNGDNGFVLDVDPDFARKLPKAKAEAEAEAEAEDSIYYARAIKVDDNRIDLEYFALRAGSCLPTRSMDLSFFAHAGDGEGCVVVLRRKDGAGPWLLSGVNFTGKHYANECFNQGDNFDPDSESFEQMVETDQGRPVIYVARGSHAMSGHPGARICMEVLGFLPLAVDYYPSRQADNAHVDYTPLTSAMDEVHQGVFTKRVQWGDESAIVGFGGGYGGKDFVARSGSELKFIAE